MKIIDKRHLITQKAKKFIQELSSDDRIYIIGTNKYGVSMINFMESNGFYIQGFVDDFCDNQQFYNYNVYKSSDLNRKDIIVNCVVEGRTIDVNKHINNLNIKSFCDYFSLQSSFNKELIEIDFLENTSSILNRSEDYRYIYDLFFDEQSKFEFNALVNFRLNRDIDELIDFKFKLSKQYFEDFFDISLIHNFVDAGSFDGSTTLEFINKKSTFDKIYIFEPNETSFDLIKSILSNFQNIEFYNKGLWDSEKSLLFNSALGSASKIEESGLDKIDTITLDSVIKNKIDFIKLDIEGAEFRALLGSEKIIKQYNPILAVCVYHNQDDFVDIPKKILEFNPNYKIYLRHYTQGVFETVMYFIP